MKRFNATLILLLCTALGAQRIATAQQPFKGQVRPEQVLPAASILEGPMPAFPVPGIAPSGKQEDRAHAAGTQGWQTIMKEGFEGNFPGTGWRTFAKSGHTEAYWDDANTRAHTGSWSAWCADRGARHGSAGGPYPGDMMAWMIYGPFDLGAATEARLDFFYWLETESNSDFLSWGASTNGQNFYGSKMSGHSGGWKSKSLDLTDVFTLGDVTGEAQVWIAFWFTSDATVGFEGAYVDDVTLSHNAVEEARVPAIAVTPASLSLSLERGRSTTRTLTIRNNGQGVLHWSLGATAGQDAAHKMHDGPPPAAAQTPEGSLRRQARDALRGLLAKAEEGGRVPVIVQLRQDFQPEGLMVGKNAVDAQRREIAAVQDAVLGDLSAYRLEAVKRFEHTPYLALHVEAAALERLADHPDVVAVYEDVAVPPTLAESTRLIGADVAWSRGFSGAGQVVAILDTGVDGAHPFLSGKVVSEACYSTPDPAAGRWSLCPNGAAAATGPGTGDDCSTGIAGCGHGTHVAGIAAGAGPSFSGVARDAGIIAIKVFHRVDDKAACDKAGRPTPCTLARTRDVMAGLDRVYALRNTFNIAAVNMSLGGGAFAAPCDTDPRKPFIDNLRAAGIATVVSAGNDAYTNALGAPGCISSAISVGATEDGSRGTTADRVADFSNSAYFLDLLAPGSSIYSSVPEGQYGSKSGTSMAAPHVAGAWAVLKAQHPNASVDEIRFALTASGVPVTDARNGLTTPRIQLDAALGTARWVQASSFSGTTQPGQSEAVRITFDAGGLPAGTHTGVLSITSNDPSRPLLEVPVSLTVTGGPAARVEVDRIHLSVQPDAVTSTTFTLRNDGSAPLDFAITASLARASAAQKSQAAARLPREAALPTPPGASSAATVQAAAAGTTPSSSFASYGEDILLLDDGDDWPDTFIGYGHTNPRPMSWYNVFEVTGSDFELSRIVFYMRTDSAAVNPVRIRIYDGDVQKLVDVEHSLPLSSKGRWYEVTLRDLGLGSPLRFAEGTHFFIVLGTSSAIGFPAAADGNGTVTGKSFFWDHSSEAWRNLNTVEGNERAAFLIRAAGTRVGGQAGPLTVDPAGGTLAAGATRTVTLTLDARGLAAGAYQGQLTITGNGGTIAIPVEAVVGTRVASEDEWAVPGAIRLSENYPNPFNPSTVLNVELPTPADVEVAVYDALGRRVAVLVQRMLPAGVHPVRFEAGALPTGIYFARLRAGEVVQTRRMLLVR